MAETGFSDNQVLRYSRQLLVPGFDLDSQRALADARVLMVGAGGLGCPVALYLAGGGVGSLTLMDPDRVEVHNLHRQIAFRETDLDRPKAGALADQLVQLNPEVHCSVREERADESVLDKLLPETDLVLDCTDNFAARRAINRACVRAGTPFVSGAAIRREGQLAAFDRRRADPACYACLYGDTEGGDERCAESGILGPVVGHVAGFQALMALYLLTGQAVPQKLHRFDGAELEWRSASFSRDPACPVCGARAKVTSS
jgi:adenylyltransferase/sulfurtransferase